MIVIDFLLAGFIYMMLAVVPRYMEVFVQVRVELPVLSRILLIVADQMRLFWPVPALALAGTLWTTVKWLRSSPKGYSKLELIPALAILAILIFLAVVMEGLFQPLVVILEGVRRRGP